MLFVAFSCYAGPATKQPEDINVLLVWPTDRNDPVFQQWTKIAEKELRHQGIRGKFSVHFSRITERYEAQDRALLNEEVLKLRSEGHMPDLILAYGDAVKWLMSTNTASVTASIPTVCYGCHFEEYLPYQYELLEDKYEGGRWDMVSIYAIPELKENLILADTLTPLAIKKLQKPEYLTMFPKRLITLLDVERFWADRLVYNELNRQMDEMDPRFYYNNLVAKVGEESLRAISRNQKKLIFSCRSLINPSWNINTEAPQMSTTWAFYPQKSSNFFLQSKHDYSSQSLVNSPSFMPYYTMVAEDFLINEKCIGGYFPLFEEQFKDALQAGLRLLEGERASDIGSLNHQASYNLNWDVIRGFGLDVNNVPDNVHLYNVTLKDRNPKLYKSLFWTILIIIITFLLSSAYTIYYYLKKAKESSAKLHKYALEILYNNDIFEQLMEITGLKTWEISGDIPDELTRIKTNAFFKKKLRDFLNIDTAGNYALQLHCSIDGKAAHWYEIRMTVSRNDNSEIVRRGIFINNDRQKELEAVAAETNRLIMSVRTREGFIASMNHEIRTPLNSIVGYTQLLSMPDLPMEEEEIREYSDAIKDNSSILKNTINNILTSTKLEKSAISVHKDIFWLNKELSAYCAERKIPADSPEEEFSVCVDKKHLFEVLDNLLDNAVKFSEGPAQISIGWRKSTMRGWTAEIWVRDKGIGIDPKYQELIFQRFFKVNSFTSGCGLGLHICKSMIELMGGEISVESSLGKGAEFRIRLA